MVIRGLSQTFPDQGASRMRRRQDLTSGYGLGFQTVIFLPIVAPKQVRRSAIPLQIGLGKTLRQARFDRVGTQQERQKVAGAKIVAVGRRSSATLEAIAAGLAKLGQALQDHTGLAPTSELTSADIIIARPGFAVSRLIIASAHNLRGIVSPITGIDDIDITAATEAGVIVANGQVIENTESMAEATILLLLAAIYDLHGTEVVLRQNLPRPRVMQARMLKGKTVGLVGW